MALQAEAEASARNLEVGTSKGSREGQEVDIEEEVKKGAPSYKVLKSVKKGLNSYNAS